MQRNFRLPIIDKPLLVVPAPFHKEKHSSWNKKNIVTFPSSNPVWYKCLSLRLLQNLQTTVRLFIGWVMVSSKHE